MDSWGSLVWVSEDGQKESLLHSQGQTQMEEETPDSLRLWAGNCCTQQSPGKLRQRSSEESSLLAGQLLLHTNERASSLG